MLFSLLSRILPLFRVFLLIAFRSHGLFLEAAPLLCIRTFFSDTKDTLCFQCALPSLLTLTNWTFRTRAPGWPAFARYRLKPWQSTRILFSFPRSACGHLLH